MFLCERCGIRFSTGALSGSRNCPRCKARDGITSMLIWEPPVATRVPARPTTTRPDSARAPLGTSP
jgi:hypothetical protein